MKKYLLLPVCCLSLFSVACIKTDEEPAAKPSRQENIEKYVRKAKVMNQLQEDRQKPLSITAPVDLAHITNRGEELKWDFLNDHFIYHRQTVEERVQETYSKKAIQRLTEMMDQHRQQAQAEAAKAVSPSDFTVRLAALLQEQNQEAQALLAEQKEDRRLLPDQILLNKIQERLNRRSEDFLVHLKFYYGPQAAAGLAPVLDKAEADYLYALATAQTKEELDEKIAQAAKWAEEQMKLVVAQRGDPVGVTDEAVISSLRNNMIDTHQKLESTLETLYDKDAVLQARPVFNRLLEETEVVLRANTPLSQKKNSIKRLNAIYKEDLLSLQRQWNAAREKASSRPPAYLLSSL